MFSTVIQDAALGFHAEVENILRAHGPLDGNMHSFAIAFATKVARHEGIQLQRIIIGEAARFPEIGRIFYKRAFRPVHDRLVQYFLPK